MTATVDRALADAWIRRWDTQQELYIADREERFAVIGDVVARAVADTADPVVLDLGCGPGSLSGRLAERLPRARIVGVDNDPLLLTLARSHYGERVEFIDANLSTSDWSSAVPARLDAAVSTTALHWLDPEPLTVLYRTLGNLIRPGGVFVNGDHMRTGEQQLDDLATLVRQGRAQRAGVTENEDWATWWEAVGADQTLAPLVTARSRRSIQHHGGNNLSVSQQAELLRQAGFRVAGAVWQSGDDHVLVAIK